MNLPEYSFSRLLPPHLRGPHRFEFNLARETASALLLFTAAAMMKGVTFLAAGAALCAAAAVFQIALSFLFRRKNAFSPALFHQALLLALFLPSGTPAAGAAGGMLLAFLFFAGGERQFQILQPVCLALALISGLSRSPHPAHFVMQDAPAILCAAVFVLWLALRFPRTGVEAVKAAPLLGMAATLAVLHETPFFFALLWSAAAFDLIFDGALAPLSKQGVKIHAAAVFILWVLLLAAGARADALVVAGLTSGFLAAWIEQMTKKRTMHGTPAAG